MNNLSPQLPKQFLEKLNKIIPEKSLKKVLQSFTKKRLPTFRTNSLKISVEKLEVELRKLNIIFEKVNWYPGAYILTDQPQSVLMDTYLYKEGYLYIQSLSSMIPPLVLDSKKDEIILDLTAAPGSKTTQIAAFMENTGKVLANDTSRPRLYRLEANLKLQGVTNTTTSQLPGQVLWQKFPEYFDKTLVDAPCSMEGRFFTEDPKSFQDWTPKKVKDLASRQCFLLRSAISATKPGGIIVYSTCTISPEENEGVIDWILEKEKENIEIEDMSIKGLEFLPGITSFSNKKYNPEVQKTLRILPDGNMEGFFVAKIRKIKSSLSAIKS